MTNNLVSQGGLWIQEDITDLLNRSGFKWPRQSKIAGAIAMVESPATDGTRRCDVNRIGDLDIADPIGSTTGWGPSFGPMMIRSRYEQKYTGGWRDADRLKLPRFNCRAAHAIFSVEGFDAWTVYTEGRYKVYLPDLYPPEPMTHPVLNGETITGIALEEGCKWQDLAALNGVLGPDYTIRVGDILELPVPPLTLISV